MPPLSLFSISICLLNISRFETPKIDSNVALQLFDTYKLCLNSVDSIYSQLQAKPYCVRSHRVSFVHCFLAWSRYSDAQNEGLLVLKSFRCLNSDGTMMTETLEGSTDRLLPELGKGSVDHDFAYWVVDVTVMLVKRVSMIKIKEEDEYRRVLLLVKEIKPWLSILSNAKRYEKHYERFYGMLVTSLKQCTVILVGDSGNLAREFSEATFKFAKSSQMAEFAQEICYSLFLRNENQPPFIIEILICVLDAMADGCKVNLLNIKHNLSCLLVSTFCL